MALSIEVGVLKVEGEDAAKFLHAIVSSDVQSLGLNESQSSLLLTPAGKVVSCFWIHRSMENSYLLVMEKEILETTFESLKRFLIRTKATIEDASDKYLAEVVFDQNQRPENAMLIEKNHLGQDGIVLCLRESHGEEISEEEKINYENLRISFGAVSVTKDLTTEVIPQEANLDKNAVSFTKGCYLGQELVCRIDSREASTPFSFFAVPKTVDALADGIETTSISNPGRSESEFGPFDRIIRVPRKLVEQLDSAIEPTRGHFSV